MTVGRICIREVHLAHSGDTILEAARCMRDRKVGALIVVDGRIRPIGILTDRDIVARAVALGKGPQDTLVGRAMTKKPKVGHEHMPIEAALEVMRTGGFRRMPVVDRSGRLAGIVTLDDILSLLAEEFGAIGKLLARERPRPTRQGEIAMRLTARLAHALAGKKPPTAAKVSVMTGSRRSDR